MKQQKFTYMPPMIDMSKVEVESGFAISGNGPDSDDSEFYY